jgi:hypothetical protein
MSEETPTRVGRSPPRVAIPNRRRVGESCVGLRSLDDPINLFASLAEFLRDLIRDQAPAGLIAARARGRKGSRPKGLPPEAERTACAAETLYRETAHLGARDR